MDIKNTILVIIGIIGFISFISLMMGLYFVYKKEFYDNCLWIDYMITYGNLSQEYEYQEIQKLKKKIYYLISRSGRLYFKYLFHKFEKKYHIS
jgi:hypothetical protein